MLTSSGVPLPMATRRKANGFTLIELMVVIAIIGLGVGAVIFVLPGTERTLYSDADRFAARVAAARDLAVVGGQPMAVWINANGYGFEQRLEGEWRPMDARGIARDNWRDGVSPVLADGATERLAFDNNGLPNTGLTIQLRSDQAAAAISVNDLGEVRVDR